MRENKEIPVDKEAGHSLAKYLVEKIMPNIGHPNPINCLIATIILVFNRIE
jgi:hypothetical protein